MRGETARQAQILLTVTPEAFVPATTRRTIHAALPNVSDEIRWSLDLRYQPIGQPTGRPGFPGFVARRRANPASELRDPVAWEESWRAARDRLAAEDDPSYNRWSSDDPACA